MRDEGFGVDVEGGREPEWESIDPPPFERSGKNKASGTNPHGDPADLHSVNFPEISTFKR